MKYAYQVSQNSKGWNQGIFRTATLTQAEVMVKKLAQLEIPAKVVRRKNPLAKWEEYSA